VIDGIHTLHGGYERGRVEYITDHLFHVQTFEGGGIFAAPNQGPDFFTLVQ